MLSTSNQSEHDDTQSILDVYTDDERNGADVRNLYPVVYQHIQECAECKADHDLMIALLVPEGPFTKDEQAELAILRANLERADRNSRGVASRREVVAIIASLSKAFNGAYLDHDERVPILIELCQYNPAYFQSTDHMTFGGAYLFIQWLYFGIDGARHNEDIAALEVRPIVVIILKKIAMQVLGCIPFRKQRGVEALEAAVYG